jgi:CheY-like chemotaxis protein
MAHEARQPLRALVEPRAATLASQVLRALANEPVLRESLLRAEPRELVEDLGTYLASLAAPGSREEHQSARRRVEWRLDALGVPANARAAAFDRCVAMLRSMASELWEGIPLEDTLAGLERDAGPRVLVVEDDPGWREVFEIGLEDAGARVYSAADPAGALALGRRHPPDLAIVDWILGSPTTGLDVIEAIRDERPETSCILVTGYSRRLVAEEAEAARAVRLIEKPFDVATLRAAVAETMSARD